MKILLTIDIETTREIPEMIGILKKKKIETIFFVPAQLLKSKPHLKKLTKYGKIGLHGYQHERFDLLNYEKKENLIKNSIRIYKKIFNREPEYFRAPQFSADFELLKILEKSDFKKDFSTTEFPFFQIIFFPSRFLTYLKQVKFSERIKNQNMKIKEVPISSFIFPFSMFFLNLLPLPVFLMIAKLCSNFKKEIVFLAHSYEFSNEKLLKKFIKFIES